MAPDPLDDTRIHPEDYELAWKMATNALELDEEDIHGEHPSHVVSLITHDEDNEKKPSESDPDEFAISPKFTKPITIKIGTCSISSRTNS